MATGNMDIHELFFKIEKGVKFPSKTCDKRLKYPFNLMEVGDSFVVSEADKRSVTTTSHNYGARHGKKFSIRTTNNVTRVWRTK